MNSGICSGGRSPVSVLTKDSTSLTVAVDAVKDSATGLAFLLAADAEMGIKAMHHAAMIAPRHVIL